jgi:hypothetical protein
MKKAGLIVPPPSVIEKIGRYLTAVLKSRMIKPWLTEYLKNENLSFANTFSPIPQLFPFLTCAG